MLYGNGAGGEPTGLIVQTGLNKPTAFAGATPTWAEVMALVAECSIDNGILGFGGQEDNGGSAGPSFAMEGQMAANLMAQAKDGGSGQFVLSDNGRVGIFPAAISNNIVSGDLWFGDFSTNVVGSWGDPDVIVNPYTSDQSGVVRVTMHHFVDVGARHIEAMGYNNDT